MSTAQSIITKAMRNLGLIASGDAPTAIELQDGLEALNSVVDSWKSDKRFYFCENDESFSLSAKANYCIGNASVVISSLVGVTTTATATTTSPHGIETGNKVTVSGAVEGAYNVTATATVTTPYIFTYPIASTTGTATGSPVFTAGDFYTSRPVRVLGAFTRSGSIDTPLGLITENYWTNVLDKITTGATQSKLLYRPNYPFGQVLVYPIPTGTPDLHLKSEKTVSIFANLTTDYLLPPGYLYMMELALSVAIAGEYQAKVSQEVVTMLTGTLNSIIDTNERNLLTSKNGHNIPNAGG